jgi:hypothetical protein
MGLSAFLAKPAAGSLINGAASIGSSFLGGLFGANEAKKNRDFQLEMWNRQNEYNKPINWRARMEEAGFNPYNALDGGSGIGQSSSLPQGSQGPTVEPAVNLAQGASDITQAFANLANARKAIAGAKGQEVTNEWLPYTLGGNVDYKNLAIGQSGYWNKSRGYQMAELDQSKEKQEFLNLQYAQKLMQAQETLTNLQADAQGVMNKYIDADNQANLAIKAQNLVNLVKLGALTEAQASREIAQTLETYARAKGLNISNEIAEKTAPAIISSTIATNALSAKEARTDMLNFKQLYKNKYERDYYNTRISEKEMKNFDRNARMQRFNQFSTGVGNAIGGYGILRSGSRSYSTYDGQGTFNAPSRYGRRYYDSTVSY